MTYIELINRFWKLDEQDPFTLQETRLYFYLVKTSNLLDWPASWSRKNNTLAAEVGISVESLRKARQRLQETGLIRFVTGGKTAGYKTRYFISDSPLPGTVTGKQNVPDIPPATPQEKPSCEEEKKEEQLHPEKNESETIPAEATPENDRSYGRELDLFRIQALEDTRWKKHIAQKSNVGIRVMQDIFPQQMDLFLSYAIASCKEQRIHDKEGLQRLFYYWWRDQGEEEYQRRAYWEDPPEKQEGDDWQQKLSRVKEWIRIHTPNLVAIRQQLTALHLRNMYRICRNDKTKLAEVLSAVNNDRFLLNRSASVYDAWKEKYRKLYGE